MFRPGEIVLAAFPFTDLSGSKLRPCAVLAVAESGDDFIVIFMNSATPQRFPRHGVVVPMSHPGWRATGSKVASVIRCDKLATLDERVIHGAMGVLPADVLAQVRAKLGALLLPATGGTKS